MEYVMYVTIPAEYFDGDDSIEVAARLLNEMLAEGTPPMKGEPVWPSMRPLSEIVSC